MENDFANPSVDFVIDVMKMLEYDDLLKVVAVANERLNEKTVIDIPPSKVEEEKVDSPTDQLRAALGSMTVKELLENKDLQDALTKAITGESPSKERTEKKPTESTEKILKEEKAEEEPAAQAPKDNTAEMLKNLLNNKEALNGILAMLAGVQDPKSKKSKKSKGGGANDDLLASLMPMMNNKAFASLPRILAQIGPVLANKSQGESMLEAMMPYIPSAHHKTANSLKPFMKIPEILQLTGGNPLQFLRKLFR